MAVTINASTSSGVITTADNTGVLQLQTNNGQTAVTIDTSQRVGIGTASPLTSLSVAGDLFFQKGTSPLLATGDNQVLRIGVNQVESMRLDTNGNVGIGTTSPLSKVDVVGIGNYDGIIRVRSTGTNTPAVVLGVDAIASAAGYVGTLNNLPFQIRTNDTERMRIDANGSLLINTTSNIALSSRTVPLQILQNNNIREAITIRANSSSYDISSINFVNAVGSQVGFIYMNASNTQYSTSSDYRLKDNIAPMTGALDKVLQLKPCTYTWKSDNSNGQGFIAHELADIVPDAVVGEKDAVDAEGNIKPQGIDTSFLVATLTAAIQEQQTIITELKSRIEALEGAK